jgi:hypothetical protein
MGVEFLEIEDQAFRVATMLFGWFAPAPPLGPREKAWVEVRMGWLADEFGTDRLRSADVVVPEEHYFPDAYEATAEGARALLDRVCGYMGVRPEEIEFQILGDEAMPGAAGQFAPAAARAAPSDLDFEIPEEKKIPETAEPPPPGVVRIAASELDDAESLVATVAHELAHAILQRRKALEGDPDREWVTDLLPVFQGLGVFLANATLRERSVRGGRSRWWAMRKHGYLSAQTIGYALAMFAWIRNERQPSWATHLRLDAADTLRRGLRYLNATEDAAFHPGRPWARPGKLTAFQLVDQIRAG